MQVARGIVRNLRVRRLQCDEIWQFVGAKNKKKPVSSTTQIDKMLIQTTLRVS